MKSRAKEAVERFDRGYACSQSLFCTYCDLLGMPEIDGYKVAEGLAGGIGHLQETCGVITSMAVLTGMKFSDGACGDGKSGDLTSMKVQIMLAEFEDIFGSINCGELLGGRHFRSAECECDDFLCTMAKLIRSEERRVGKEC